MYTKLNYYNKIFIVIIAPTILKKFWTLAYMMMLANFAVKHKDADPQC